MKNSGNKPYKIRYVELGTNACFDAAFKAISKSGKLLILRAIEQRLAFNPKVFGKPLRHNLKGCRSFRVSVYRVIYKIDEPNHTINILLIDHRKDVYGV